MKSKWPLYFGASLKTAARAKRLRRKSTEAEKIFWKIIRNREIKGFKFRRQHPIQYYIADFYCHEAKLVIELDGDIHDLDEIKVNDKRRQAAIQKHGLSVLRFTNEEILSDPGIAVKKIEEYLAGFKTSP